MTDGEIADLLMKARLNTFLTTISVHDTAQAYRVQSLVMAELGQIGGWKVGAPGPDGPISCAPMPASGLFTSPHDFDAGLFTQRQVESEICFCLNDDLPQRASPYSLAEIMAAIGSCHPGIEVLQSRLTNSDGASPLALLADFIQTGAYVIGAPMPSWRHTDFSTVPVAQTIDDGDMCQHVGNPAGDMMRLVAWLANVGAAWAGGLRAGQVITCGSWTGKLHANGTVRTVFGGAEPVLVQFR